VKLLRWRHRPAGAAAAHALRHKSARERSVTTLNDSHDAAHGRMCRGATLCASKSEPSALAAGDASPPHLPTATARLGAARGEALHLWSGEVEGSPQRPGHRDRYRRLRRRRSLVPILPQLQHEEPEPDTERDAVCGEGRIRAADGECATPSVSQSHSQHGSSSKRVEQTARKLPSTARSGLSANGQR
jgi:hypothetical protein